MNVPVTSSLEKTLSSFAYSAIEKHFHKTIKHEEDVLSDRDPEPLHQMRVGMRRLRTAIQVFGFAIELPKSVSERRIRKFAQVLGTVRDTDVMELELTSNPSLPKSEQETLARLLKKLHHHRSRYFHQLEKTLSSHQYTAFKEGFEDWLALPQYSMIAHLPIQDVLPDLLLPLISNVLLHPAWLVGVEVDSGETIFAESTPKFVHAQLSQQGDRLHDLRKQMKRVRYQTELFIEFYGDDYAAQVEDFKHIQGVLGELQDSAVLQVYLSDRLEEPLRELCPTLAKQLDQKELNAWKQWRSLQQKYLNPKFRSQLRQQILHHQ